MEKSLLSFAATYPSWEPDEAAKRVLTSVTASLPPSAPSPDFPYTAHIPDPRDPMQAAAPHLQAAAAGPQHQTQHRLPPSAGTPPPLPPPPPPPSSPLDAPPFTPTTLPLRLHMICRHCTQYPTAVTVLPQLPSHGTQNVTLLSRAGHTFSHGQGRKAKNNHLGASNAESIP